MLIHKASDWEQRRALEEAMGWGLIPHRLPPCDLPPPPLPVFKPSPSPDDHPGYILSLKVGDTFMSFCQFCERWKRVGERRWVEEVPPGRMRPTQPEPSYRYIALRCRTRKNHSSLFYLESSIGHYLVETHRFSHSRLPTETNPDLWEVVASDTWVGKRQGEWNRTSWSLVQQ